MNPNKDEKDMSEQQELDHYEEGNTWLEEAKRDMSWVYRLQNEAQTMEERRVSQLLLATLPKWSSLCFKLVSLPLRSCSWFDKSKS